MPIYVDTILCDAVRQEANNKVTLLGVFGKAILVPKIPTKLAGLAIVQRWEPGPDENEGRAFMFAFELRGPGIETVRFPEQRATVGPGPQPQLNIVIQFQGFPVAQQGEYHVATFIDGQEAYVYTFSIGEPTDEQRLHFQLNF